MTDMQKKMQEYAEKKFWELLDVISTNPWNDVKTFLAQAFEDGYTACEQSMWRSVEDELPENDRLVLAHFSDVDPEVSYASAYYRNGAWQTPDDWYYDCKIDFWMPIMPPSLPNTNTEKK